MSKDFYYTKHFEKSNIKERAYAFENLGYDRFKVSIAVLNLSSLLRNQDYTTVDDYMENVKNLCSLGCATSSNNRKNNQHDMLHDYFLGSIRTFHEIYTNQNKKLENYTVYSAEINFRNLEEGLCCATSNIQIKENQQIQCSKNHILPDCNTEEERIYELDDVFSFYNHCQSSIYFGEKYEKMPIAKNASKTVSDCVVWAGGNFIKSVFSSRKVVSGDVTLMAIRDQNSNHPSFNIIRSLNQQGLTPSLAKPLSEPVSELNKKQIASLYSNGKPLFNGDQVTELAAELNAYSRQYAEMCKQVPCDYKYGFDKLAFPVL